MSIVLVYGVPEATAVWDLRAPLVGFPETLHEFWATVPRA